MKVEGYDFAGWATRNDLKCSDGRTIRKDAFADQDGEVVPLVWNHQHNGPTNVLGHALLENRKEGVYTYGFFNDSETGQVGKELVLHGDIKNLSIYANRLKENKSTGDVHHGVIREVSLVLAGANPGAWIDSVLEHDDESDGGAIIYTDEEISLYHSDNDDDEDDEDETTVKKDDEDDKDDKNDKDDKPDDENDMDEDDDENPDDDEEGKDVGKEMKHADKDKTIKEIFDTLTDEQKEAVYAVIGMAVEDEAKHSEEDDEVMKHNVFDNDENTVRGNELSREDVESIMHSAIEDVKARRFNTLKEAFMSHAEQEYGIDGIDLLFPDTKAVNNTPYFVKRDTEWVSKFMNATHHVPFSRIKSLYADITEDDARARGYLKGNKKVEEVFELLMRPTDPQTIYKKQKLDRDDIIDITDFDVVSWLKQEMRWMLDEEIARAALIGDGRSKVSPDKIFETHIRSIYNDDDVYTIPVTVTIAADATDDDKAAAFIRAAVKARKDFKGTGVPTMYTTEETLTNMLLMTDKMGRDLYDSVDKLATKLRVKEIVTVEVMEGVSRDGKDLAAIIVNPADYTFGADRGGAVSMFDDFDIDYNQQKYLIETRCSGALTKPYSAMVLEYSTASGNGTDSGNDTPTEGEDETTNP